MATDFNANDAFRFDDGLDFDFGNIEADQSVVPDDRTPVTKIRQGATQGAKNYVRDPKKVMQFMRTAMPNGYGKAYDLGRESVEEVQSLYNTAREEIKPAVKAAKNITAMALPMARGILPKKIFDRIEEFSKPEEEYSYQSRSEEEAETDRVNGLLGEIFKAQTELDKQREERQTAQEQLAEGVEQIRHKGQMQQLDQIRLAVTSLQKYQDRVTVNYQKRSLELQYRHYWTAVEALKNQKESNKTLLENMAAIAKNTGLPDYAKLQNKEAFLEQSRNKFISEVRDGLFGTGTNYVRQFGENARKQVKGMLGQFRAGFEMAEGSLSPMLGPDNMMDGFGISKEEMIGEEAANYGMDYGAAKLGGRVRRALNKNKTISRMDGKVGYATNNMFGDLDDALTNPNRNWGRAEGLRTILASIAPQRTTDTNLELPLMRDMTKARQFNYQDSKSLTEIIPGLLARIHREVRMFRTGEENVPLITYDFEKSRFSNEKEQIAGIRKKFGEGSNVAGNLDKIIDEIDRNKTLSPEQRKAMREALIQRTLSRSDMSARSMTNSQTWGGDDQIAGLFKSYYRTDAEGRMGKSRAGYRRANSFQNAVQSTVSSIGDPMSYVQDMVNMGQYGTLLKAGVITENGTVDLQAMSKLAAGEGLAFGPGDMGETFAPTRAGGKGGRSKTVNIDKSRYNFDTSKLEKTIQQAAAQNKGRDDCCIDKTRIESIDETLQRIEAIILEGVKVQTQHFTHVGGDPDTKSYTSLLSHLYDKGKSGAKAVGSSVKQSGLKAFRLGRRATEAASNALAPFKLGMGNVLARGRKKFGGFFNDDVFVGNERKARLLSSVLKAGGYVDSATNKVITSLKGLKGDVKDLQGNVILRIDELEDAYVAGQTRRKLSDIIGSVASFGGNIVSSVANLVPNAVKTAIELGKSAFNMAKRILPAYDVYLTGDRRPTLYASAFRAGTYFSERSRKPIFHPSKIDGPVIDSDGNIVLSEEQIQRGLVDAQGVQVANPLLRGIRKAMKPIGAALGVIKDLGMGALSFVTNKMKDGARFIKELISGRINVGIYSKRTSDILTEIRDFMYSTWGKKKRVAGDMNGDGIRDNSLEDLARKRKEKGETGVAQTANAKENSPSFLTKVLASVGGLFDRFRKKDKDDEDDEDDGDGFGLDDAADIADIADAAGEADERRKGRKSRKRGKSRRNRRLRKLPKGAKKAGTKAAQTAGRSLLSRGMFSTFMPKLLGRGALVAGGAAASTASAAVGAGGAVAGAGALVLKGAAALMSWPAALAVGGVMVGMYAWKKYKETKVTPMSTVRMAQYGLNVEKETMPMVKKVFALEQLLMPLVKYDNAGWASVDRNQADPKEIAELFGLESAYQAKRFAKWFDERFVHVFTRTLSKMRQYKVDKPDLWDIESQIETTAKEKFLDDVVASCENYHDYMKGPPGYPNLNYDHEGVMSVMNDMRIKFRSEEKKATGKAAEFKAPETVAGLMSGKTAAEKAKMIAANREGYEVRDQDGNVLQDLTEKELEKALKDGAKIVTKVEVPKNVLLNDPTRLDALTCIRFKTYGLKSMVADKVAALLGLEAICAKNITVSKEGATFNISVNEILAKSSVVFGKTNTNGKQAQDWKLWFSNRFLPVFLPFYSAVNRLTGSSNYVEAVKKLTPEQQLKLANMLTGASSVGDSRVARSVWEVEDSPWADYQVGLNPDVVINNVETIRALVAKIELKEPLTETTKPTSSDPSKAAIFYKSSTRPQTHGSAGASSTKGMMATGDFVGNLAPPGESGAPMRIGEPVKFGSGNGRKWADLPNATGVGWHAMKDLIIEAAKATGVDPKLLASYIAVESSFDPNARPKGGGRALGLGQHMPDTWKEMMQRYGAKLGIPAGTPRTDPRAAALLTAMYLKQNAKEIGKNIGRDISGGEGYLGHFAGATGATNLLDVLAKNPNAIGAEVRPAAAASNPNIFYDKKTKRPYTVKEVVDNLNKKLEKSFGDFGISASDFGGGSGATSAASATENLAPAQVAQNPGNAAIASAAPNSSPAPSSVGNPAAAMQQNARPAPAASMSAANVDLSVKANLTPSGPPLPAGNITLFLKRDPSTNDGTFGILQFPDGTSLMTLELPWKDNKTGISCIPAGTYKCKRRQTSNFGMAYEVYGVPQRSAILIHAGNSAGASDLGKKADSRGCILLGQGRGTRGSQKIITSSQAAMKVFYEKMQSRDFTLTITAAAGEEMSQTMASDGKTTARENIVRAAEAAPNNVPSGSMVGGGGGNSAAAAPAPAAAPSGLRSTIASVQGASTIPSSGFGGGSSRGTPLPSISLSPNSKPTQAEMAARDSKILEEMAESQKTATTHLNALVASAARREELLRELVKVSGGKAKEEAAPKKVSASVDAKPISTGRGY